MKRTHTQCTVSGCANPHDARGLCRVHYRRAARNAGDPTAPLQVKPKGSGWIQRGYRMITVNGQRRPEHVAVVERTYGPLPPGALVHHADGNGLNNAPGNLVVCGDHKYHKLLHVRMRALAATGNPNARKCPYCGTFDLPQNMRGERSGRYVHRECSAAARRSARQRRPA